MRADLGAAFQREAITARLTSIRVPTILVRAEKGFTPDQPPLFPDLLALQIQMLVPQLEDHKIPGTTHYTVALGDRAATRIADLIAELSLRRSMPVSGN